MSRYTFTTVGKDGKAYFPSKPLVGKFVGAGLLDFEWTEDITKAITWNDEQTVETVAIEFCDSVIVEVSDKDPKHGVVIKTLE